MSWPAIPDHAALLLDMDGTLLDLAPTPAAVVVPDGLIESLWAQRRRLGDALAVITGRPIEQVNALLGGAPYAVAGEHGAAIRFAPDSPVQRPDLPAPPAAWLVEAERAVAACPGALLERKSRGFVLHYRLAPSAGPALGERARALVADAPDRFAIVAAHMAWEIRPRGIDKGSALATLMQAPPFAGRRPIFVGDDVTDEDGIAAAIRLGGDGFRVQDVFGAPDGVRAWLAHAPDRAVQDSGPAQRAT